MKKTVCTKLLLALLIVGMLVSALPMAAMAAEDQVYTLEASALTAFAKDENITRPAETAGTDNFFKIFWSNKSAVEADKSKKFGEEELTGRINFGGSTEVGADEIKNAIEFTVDGAATVKIWWVQGGNKESDAADKRKPVRNMALYNSSYEVVDATEETAETSWANDAHVSELEIAEAGTYYLGVNPSAGGNNYIFKVVVTVKAPVEDNTGDNTGDNTTDDTVTETPNTADNSGLFFLMAIMVVSMAAVLVFGKKAVR